MKNQMEVFTICGPIAAGKSTFVKELANLINGRIITTSSLIPGKSRIEKQKNGDSLDSVTQYNWVMKAAEKLEPTAESPVIIDCVRHLKQYHQIDTRWPMRNVLIGIRCSDNKAWLKRVADRTRDAKDITIINRAMEHPNEKNQVIALLSIADIIIDTKRMNIGDIIKCAT